ncbi:ABC transporter ATP-binding protein [Planctomonas sp. JC2975]|uniref:ATP-binding cassette domain-containing protein n=1 Tax=Planctomonas sp. JC2975 TaxID=2729626 RepID=UPI001475484E|nr:ABC transporter ATP-binding protein [Planctomonas sp. JC2975]
MSQQRTTHTLAADHVTLAYDDRVVVDDLALQLPQQGVTMIVGANGCGKSTLLRALARLLTPAKGAVLLDGSDIRRTPTKAVARVVGLLPQSPVAPEGVTVAELVGRGRYPHQSWSRPWSARDDEAVAEALTSTGILELTNRRVEELSGGQRQRVWIAMALAQEPDILLLDEPTTYLDVAHQIDVLDLLVDLSHRGTAVVVVMHELNLATRYADHLIAMKDGSVVADGTPREIVTGDLVRDVFGLDAAIVDDPVSGTPLVIPIGRHRTGSSASFAAERAILEEEAADVAR